MPVVAVGIAISVAVALLQLIGSLIVRAFEETDKARRDALWREHGQLFSEITAAVGEAIGKPKNDDLPKFKNDDLCGEFPTDGKPKNDDDFGGEDYFVEEDEFATFEELLSEKPDAKKGGD